MKIYSKDKKRMKMNKWKKWINEFMQSHRSLVLWKKSLFNYSKILDVIKWQKNCCHHINMIQWNYLLKTIGNKKDENKYNNNMFFGTKEQKNKRITDSKNSFWWNNRNLPAIWKWPSSNVILTMNFIITNFITCITCTIHKRF